MTCPMCRAHFDKNFLPSIDKGLQEEIKEQLGEEFETRKAELMSLGEWAANRKWIKFIFGNTHEMVENPKPSNSNSKLKNSHRWAMFLSLNDNPEMTSKYIESVTYHLHPTFKVNVIKVSEAPFLLSRVGWGTFDVTMKIKFHAKWKIPAVELVHELSFDGKGNQKSIMMDVPDSEGNDLLAEQLAKEI
jgi:transcription initiation factor IIF auxiliary subunit